LIAIAIQDMKQYSALGHNFHYIKYDNLNRIIENGYFNASYNITDSIARNPVALTSWLNSGSSLVDITHTYYDNIFTIVPGLLAYNY
jgi:hypothetical protein